MLYFTWNITKYVISPPLLCLMVISRGAKEWLLVYILKIFKNSLQKYSAHISRAKWAEANFFMWNWGSSIKISMSQNVY